MPDSRLDLELKRQTTTDATVFTALAPHTVKAESAARVVYRITAHNITDGTDSSVDILVLVVRVGTGAAAFVGTKVLVAEEDAGANFPATTGDMIVVSVNDVSVTITGLAAKTINWVIEKRVTE